jgi:hypothetical protein
VHRSLVALALVLLFCGVARADIVRLANGREIKGEVEKDDGDELVIRTSTGKVRVKRKLVESITRSITAHRMLDQARELLKSGETAKAVYAFEDALDAARAAGEDGLASDIEKELDQARVKAGLPRTPPTPKKPRAPLPPPPSASSGPAYYLRVASASLGGKVGTSVLAFDVKVTSKDGVRERLARLEKWSCALSNRLRKLELEPRSWLEMPVTSVESGARVEIDVWDVESNDLIAFTQTAFVLGTKDFGGTTKPEQRLVRLGPTKIRGADAILDGAELVIELVRADRKAAPGIDGKKVLGELRLAIAKANIPAGGDPHRLQECWTLVEGVHTRLTAAARASTDPAFRQAASEVGPKCLSILSDLTRETKPEDLGALAAEVARGIAAVDDLMKTWSDR